MLLENLSCSGQIEFTDWTPGWSLRITRVCSPEIKTVTTCVGGLKLEVKIESFQLTLSVLKISYRSSSSYRMVIKTFDSSPLLAYTKAPFTPEANMELRKHPKMTWQGRPNWPPKWTGPHNSQKPLPEGEVGVLMRVETTDPSLIAPHCILVTAMTMKTICDSVF